MYIGFDREASRGENALGRFHIGGVEPEALRQLEPAFDTALGADIAVMVLDPVAPFHPDGAVAEAGDHHRLPGTRPSMIIIAVQGPGLDLALVQLAAMENEAIVRHPAVARLTEHPQRCFQVAGAVEP